jgi:hypothetical protein
MIVGAEITDIKGQVERAIQQAVGKALQETHTFSVVAGGQRGRAVNTLIASVQAKQLRDPFWLNKPTLEALRFAVRGLTSVEPGIRSGAVRAISDLLLKNIMENVAAQMNKGGSAFRRLTDEYINVKRRKFNFVVPILKATGDLLGGLRVLVDRQRR